MHARTRAAGAALLTTAILVAGAPSAYAAPADCGYQISTGERWATSLCTSGTGEHRIRVLQRHFLPEIGLIPIEGPWQPVGTVSYTGISPHTTVSVWVETRG
ncbi:hypothetical protein SAMN05444920_102889 [Nonomuraea solani]|uniref:Secreted protein n=1 Tax=Nonomuraea solani TaxID=1144553 RepID=A0A1H5ZVN0_9ACTN|nr:hypothetical protein [Nonomuraea solani]SEG40220.1 hypothetical protein SAMN05444920_102889 [Nonomuraea solani]